MRRQSKQQFKEEHKDLQQFMVKEIPQFHVKSQQSKQGRWEGLELTEAQKEYLLPHFNMLVVGKPGSGKTACIRKLLQDKNMYFQKFDHVLIMSPSATKMGIAVPKANAIKTLDLDWMYEHFAKINVKQFEKMRAFVQPLAKSMQPLLDQDFIKDHVGITKDMKQGASQVMVPTKIKQFDSSQRFFTTQVMASIGGAGKYVYNGAVKKMFEEQKKPRKGKSKTNEMKKEYMDAEWIEQNYVKKLTFDQQKKTHCNVLVIMDDVVGEIKRHENDVELAQLFYNRRHLIANGTISTITVSQKYTMVPARVRSAVSWNILYRLNPNDFETVFNDIISFNRAKWSQLLYFVYDFDSDMNGDEQRTKRYDNLGIWVEFDKFFKNFEPVMTNRLQ